MTGTTANQTSNFFSVRGGHFDLTEPSLLRRESGNISNLPSMHFIRAFHVQRVLLGVVMELRTIAKK
jgi:hypothetical protein